MKILLEKSQGTANKTYCTRTGIDSRFFTAWYDLLIYIIRHGTDSTKPSRHIKEPKSLPFPCNFSQSQPAGD
jgi:hypothetical protein